MNFGSQVTVSESWCGTRLTLTRNSRKPLVPQATSQKRQATASLRLNPSKDPDKHARMHGQPQSQAAHASTVMSRETVREQILMAELQRRSAERIALEQALSRLAEEKASLEVLMRQLDMIPVVQPSGQEQPACRSHSSSVSEWLDQLEPCEVPLYSCCRSTLPRKANLCRETF